MNDAIRHSNGMRILGAAMEQMIVPMVGLYNFEGCSRDNPQMTDMQFKMGKVYGILEALYFTGAIDGVEKYDLNRAFEKFVFE